MYAPHPFRGSDLSEPVPKLQVRDLALASLELPFLWVMLRGLPSQSEGAQHTQEILLKPESPLSVNSVRNGSRNRATSDREKNGGHPNTNWVEVTMCGPCQAHPGTPLALTPYVTHQTVNCTSTGDSLPGFTCLLL